MSENFKSQKNALRVEAKRARGMMSLDASAQVRLCDLFFKSIPLDKKSVVGAYYPKGRELDTLVLIDELLARGVKVALPVVKKGAKVLKFAGWDGRADLIEGAFGICEPKKKKYLEPDIFIVPLLAFDRRGMRLGYGGGYYDATLAYYRAQKDILAVGLAYAQQACLFNLPAEEHDVPMDMIITEQDALSF